MRPQIASTVIGQLAARLRRDIALGILLPGARLNIETLKREHKVSQPSVREALALLVGEGFVSSEENKGYRVLGSSLSDLKDTTRVRAELECTGLAWSIERTDKDWRAAVVAAHYALSEVEADMLSDSAEFVTEWDERNKQFHMALINHCGSPRLIETVSTFYDLTRRYRLMAYSISHADHRTWLERSAQEHIDLRECALSGDAKNGRRLLLEHINKSAAGASATVLQLTDAARPMGRIGRG